MSDEESEALPDAAESIVDLAVDFEIN